MSSKSHNNLLFFGNHIKFIGLYLVYVSGLDMGLSLVFLLYIGNFLLMVKLFWLMEHFESKDTIERDIEEPLDGCPRGEVELATPVHGIEKLKNVGKYGGKKCKLGYKLQNKDRQ